MSLPRAVSLEAASSFLFVPGDRPDRFGKAFATAAHRIIIDLEDAVAPADKVKARREAGAWLANGGGGVIRVNDVSTPWHAEDVALCRSAAIDAVLLPKAEDAAMVAALHADLGKPVIALIETARGLHHAPEIAGAPGVVRLAFGAIDFSLDLTLNAPDEALDGFRLQLTLASRLGGCAQPVDGVQADFRDVDALTSSVSRVRGLGFGAKLCIHPAQVERVNTGFSPDAEEVAWAERVAALGEQAVALDGVMVDRPVRTRALRILERAGRSTTGTASRACD